MELAEQLDSDTIILRVPRPGDGEMLYDALSDVLERLKSRPNSWTWADNPQSPDISEEYCKVNHEFWKSTGNKWPLLIIEKQSGKVAGVFEFYRREWGWEVGAWSRPVRMIANVSRDVIPIQGIMTEAALAVRKYFITHDPTAVVVMGIESSNKAAIRLVEKMGCRWSHQYINPDRNNAIFEIYEWRYHV